MKESYFIGASEVQEIVGCSKSRAYQFIQQMNKELEAKGLLTFPGRVPRRYVFERFGITEVQDDAKGNNPAGGNSGGASLVLTAKVIGNVVDTPELMGMSTGKE